MTPDTEDDELPTTTRRETLAFLGVGSVSVPGLIATFDSGTMVGLPRAEGAPVSVERDVTDHGVEYRPTTDTVKWSRSTDQTEPYTAEPFEKWAYRRSASVGSDVVLPTIQNRVGEEVTGIEKAISRESIGLVITVTIGTTYDREGDAISEPNISKDRLVRVTPRTATSKITLDERTYTRSVPVFIEEGDLYLD